MAKVGSTVFFGVSRQAYAFEVWTLDSSFNDVAVVYVFAKPTHAAGLYQPVYIGETGQLGTRLTNHEKWPCVRREGATLLAVHHEPNAQTRLNKEADLRAQYDPACNRQ
jgi:hypothetical protein